MDQMGADSGRGQRVADKEDRHQLDEIISRSPVVAFVLKNADGWPVDYVSDNVHVIFGWDKSDLLSGRTSYAQIVHPEDLPRIVREKTQVVGHSGKVVHAPYRVVARDGSVRWVEEFTTVVWGEEGGIRAFEGVLIDITDRRKMEEKLHLIEFSVDHASEGITWIDSDAHIVYANNEECRRLGYSREELLGMTVFDIDPTVTPRSWYEQWEELRHLGAITREAEHRDKNGDVFPIESTIKFIRYGNKEFSFAFRRDIGERKRVEEEQLRLQAKLINAMEMAHLGPWEHDLVSDTFILNDHFFRLYRTAAMEVGGYVIPSEKLIRYFVHPEDAPSVKIKMQEILARPQAYSNHQLEHRFLHPDGSVGHMAVRLFFVEDAEGRVIKAYGVNQDITERKLAERERLANLKLFESMDMVNRAMQRTQDIEQMMRNSMDAVLSIFKCDRAFLLYPCDPDAASWSVPMERTVPEFAVGTQPWMKMEMDGEAAQVFRTVLDAGRPMCFGGSSGRFLPKDIETRLNSNSLLAMALQPKMGSSWLFGVHQCSYSREWSPEEEKLLQGIGRRLGDVLSSMLMYRDLRKSESFLNSIVENIPDTILVKESETFRIMRVNKAGEKLLGLSREEILGKNVWELFPEDQAEVMTASDRQAMGKGMLVDIPEEDVRRKDGSEAVLHTQKIPILEEDGVPQHLLVIAEDITEIKKLQAQLTQAQKMEALGTMSGGIAHDFNNILQPMIGYCELLREELAEDREKWHFVDEIYSSGLRARDLVNQILTFSRRSEREFVPVMLQSVLSEAIRLGRSIIPTNIEMEYDIAEGCGAVLSDTTQLHQIFMNLIINAWHAMEETGGMLSIRLEERALEAGDLENVPLQPGRYAVISVADTGCGMESEVMGKIFEPYFTTKPQGKGSGLGLAVVYGIVKEHSGYINAVSGVGKGTTFTVCLPLTDAPVETSRGETMEICRAEAGEHILFVDDEEIIIEMGTEILGRMGYHVTACHNGAEALKVFTEAPGTIDLVITDMNMPHMTGDRLAAELIKIRPDIPIIICSGFNERMGREEMKAMGIRGVLNKPVKLAEMSRKVREVLDDEKNVKASGVQ